MKAKFGAIVVDGRGKIGGHVFSKNRGGAYMRTKVTPSNPNTVAQSKARGIFSSLSQAWSGLTNEQRLAWNNSVSDWSKTDIFGDIKNPSGLNLYVKVNTNLLNVDRVILSVPPVKVEVPSNTVADATYVIATGVLTINIDGIDADGTSTIIRATKSLSQGVSYVKNELRVIDVDSPVLGVITTTGSYADKFGVILAGANVYASIQYVTDSGQKSVEQTLKVTVTA
jgi:hypothetical protein